ncbi:MAG: hypothetical protein EB027_00835 [Actinobacteria bacterium]|nr:hypothetical protein [Actinomycetota bacterium]
MATARWFVVVVLLGTGSVVQSSLLPALGLDTHTAVLVFLVIIALAQRLDFNAALTVGCAGGLLVDLTPPALGPLGLNALLGTLCAAAMYAWSRATAVDTATISATLAVLLTAVALTVVGRSTLMAIFRDAPPLGTTVSAVARDVVIAALAAPLLLPAVTTLSSLSGSAGSRRQVRL